MIDNELAVVKEGYVAHVFEREHFSLATYTYMINWVQRNKNPYDDVDIIWKEAEQAWDALSPDVHGLLLTIAEKERQQNKDIHDGLLATLCDYQGSKRVKDSFVNAIRSCLW